MAKRDFIRIPKANLDGGDGDFDLFLSPSRIQAVEYVPGVVTRIHMNTQYFHYAFWKERADEVFAILRAYIDPTYQPPAPTTQPTQGETLR